MNHASLFSGIGGFDLAAEWMGWNNVLSCEIDPFCNKVLKYHFPNAVHIGDIKQAKFKRDDRGNVYLRVTADTDRTGGRNGMQNKREWEAVDQKREGQPQFEFGQICENETQAQWQNLGPIDIISGGFPCQPFSLAGKRRGTDDDRHLWPEMLRAIRDIQPRWVVGENVYGFTNWSGGLVFRQVLSDLENEGYEVQPFIIPACAVNAPHRRDRVWIVAHAKEGRNGKLFSSPKTRKQIYTGSFINGCCQNGPAADTKHNNLQDRKYERRSMGKADKRQQAGGFEYGYLQRNWHNFPTQPPLRGRNDGVPSGLDGITVSKLRNESIKAYGNAVVPQVVHQIFKAIQQYEDLCSKPKYADTGK